jgi:hypothetical protein
MNRLKLIVALCSLVFALSVAGVAQTVVTQLPTTCTAGTQYLLYPSGGAYTGLPQGYYNCLPGNVLAMFSGGGANTLGIVGADFVTAATSTPATFLSYPVLANITYQYSCALFYSESGSVAPTFTVTAPASPTNLFGFAQVYSTNTGTNTSGVLSSGAFSGATVGATSTVYKATIEGILENGATAGTLAFQVSAGSTSNSTIKRGSYCSARSLP